MTLLFLMARYPALSGFIKECYHNGEQEKLWDFMVAIETDDMRDS